MTHEAERAKANAVNFEGWKWKITEQTGGKFRIPFDVKSEDLPESVKNAPVGTRFQIVVVELNDDETAKEIEKPKSYATQAKMMALDFNFWDFGNQSFGKIISPEDAEEYIESECGVKSCSELIEGTEAGRKFKQLQAKFMEWKNG